MEFKDKQKTLFERIKKLRENPTHSEIVFESKLKLLGVKYIFQKGFIQGDYYCIVDFYLPKPYKLCIEIDGGYHETNQLKDRRKDNYLKKRGFEVLRLKNENAEMIHQEDLRTILEA